MRKEILLCRIESKENVGSIFRLAYQFGFNKIYSYQSANPGKTNTYKTERHIPIIHVPSLDFMKELGIPRIALETGGTGHSYEYPKGYLIGVGNESHGFNDKELSYFNLMMTLKSKGRESYNVSHALAIALYKIEIK